MSKLKLLIDACVARSVVDRLSEDGHDAVSIFDYGSDPGDAAVLALAVAEQRILITADTDFGALVFRDKAAHVGVLRLRERPPKAQAERASDLVAAHADDLAAGAFVTDDGDTARVSKR